MSAGEPMSITVHALQDLAQDDAQDARIAIEAIFWETTVAPPTGVVERAAFHDLWLGQYLRHDPNLAFVAFDRSNGVVGYLVGTFESLATSPRFKSLPYTQSFARAVAAYPGHLHVNLTVTHRGRGIGRQLIQAFAVEVYAAGLRGFHVVTGADARNVSFYKRQEFHEIDRAANARGNAIVFLGRSVANATLVTS